jgi:ABC-2 type transport system permease protein
MKPATAEAPALPADAADRGGFEARALGALFTLTLRQHLRGRRLLLLSLLFVLPSVLAVIVRLAPYPPPPAELEFGLVFNLIPHALATLTALLYAASIVQDEVEGQTLTYLLLRPLPRWALYLTKLLATVLVTAALTGVFTVLAMVVIYWGTPEFWGEVLPGRALKAAALMALAQLAYCSLFGAISLWTRRVLVVGLAYIIAFEGLMASLAMVARRLTVMYYFRVLAARWLDPAEAREWSLDLPTAPGAGACVAVLLGASAVLALLGAFLMTHQEFRMKTPEGS